MEARLLQLLCQPGLDSASTGLDRGPEVSGNSPGRELRDKVYRRLRTYSFRSAIHQVLFDCLFQLPRNSPERIRELLPAKLVQAGFPDVELARFFEPHRLTASEAEKLLEKLCV